jgi:DNA-binding transcriptional LysR family regulator
MDMRNVELSDLEIFRSVALEGGVSRAAQRLHRVQSNISTRIRQLEDRLGVRLFLRQSRGLTLTPAGEALLPYAERLLDLSSEAEAALTDGKPRGNFRVGTLESTAAARLPDVLSRYHACYPDVQVELSTDTTQGLLDRLLEYEIEVAFVAGPISHAALDTAPVFSEELVLVTPESFPPITRIDEMSGKTVIAFKVGCAYRRYLEDWMLEAGITPGGVLETSSYHVILACVAAGTGFAAVPRSVLDAVAVKGEFRVHPLPGPASKVDTLLTWRCDYTSAKLDALKEILIS